ncbi:MAG: hypothetical protein WC477_04900 [Patescibacteria group bacterium]
MSESNTPLTIADLEEMISLQQRIIARTQDGITAIRQNIVHLIQSGISSGDSVVDLLYRMHVDPDDCGALKNNFRSLVSVIHEHKGQLIVLEYISSIDALKHVVNSTLFDSHPQIETGTFLVGILNDDDAFPLSYQHVSEEHPLKVDISCASFEPVEIRLAALAFGLRHAHVLFEFKAGKEPEQFSCGGSSSLRFWIGNAAVAYRLQLFGSLQVEEQQALASKIKALLARNGVELPAGDELKSWFHAVDALHHVSQQG